MPAKLIRSSAWGLKDLTFRLRCPKISVPSQACAAFVAVLLTLTTPSNAAVGIETLGLSQHRENGTADTPVDEDYFWSSEYSGRERTRRTWTDVGQMFQKPRFAPISDGTLILEYFSYRNRTLKPYIPIARYIVVDGVPASGPIQTLSAPIKAIPIQRLGSYSPGLSVVPLPATLPMLALAMFGIAFVARRKR
jgi:hypothetical protein